MGEKKTAAARFINNQERPTLDLPDDPLPPPQTKLKAVNLPLGMRFGRLTVIGPGARLYERLKCDCGVIVEKRRGDLKAGHCRRCGFGCKLGELKPEGAGFRVSASEG